MDELQNTINLSFKKETPQFHVAAAKHISELVLKHWKSWRIRQIFYAHVAKRKSDATENESIHYGRVLYITIDMDFWNWQHLYEKTITSARNSAVALLGCCKRRKKQIPRDVALLIARMVWDSRMDVDTIHK